MALMPRGHADTIIKGNHWCARDYGNGSNAYHYSNQSVPFGDRGRYPICSAYRTAHIRSGTDRTTILTRTEARTTTMEAEVLPTRLLVEVATLRATVGADPALVQAMATASDVCE
jgi:hypothetical protein